MPSLRSIRSFSSVLIKSAASIVDSDIRAQQAERKGEEYLEGGKLLSNTAQEVEYPRKMANFRASSVPMSTYDMRAKTKKDNKYQTVRDYSGAALKGGLTGLGVLAAHNAMRGHFGSPAAGHETFKAMHRARKAFGVGATATVADRAYRHDEIPGHNKQAFVGESPNAGFGSPGNELANNSRVGSFKSGIHNNAGKSLKPLQLGQKFKMPTMR